MQSVAFTNYNSFLSERVLSLLGIRQGVGGKKTRFDPLGELAIVDAILLRAIAIAWIDKERNGVMAGGGIVTGNLRPIVHRSMHGNGLADEKTPQDPTFDRRAGSPFVIFVVDPHPCLRINGQRRQRKHENAKGTLKDRSEIDDQRIFRILKRTWRLYRSLQRQPGAVTPDDRSIGCGHNSSFL